MKTFSKKLLEEFKIFQIGNSFIFAAQIPDDSVGCSGSSCTNCGGPVAYCNQVCRGCGLPLIGPLGFPQIGNWVSLPVNGRRSVVESVYYRLDHGHLGYANVPSVPLTPDEAERIKTVWRHESEIFRSTHGVSPDEAASWKDSLVLVD
jgi:hypothetical protein